MSEQPRPVVVAFDGSPPSEAALRHAVALFGDRPLVVATVWEPSLAYPLMTVPDATGMLAPMPSPQQVEAIDSIERERAAAVAEAGAALARSLGATAEVHAERDRLDAADTLSALAERLDAAAIVVGSRGLGATKARLLGSVSRRLVQDARRPVLVVHDDAPPAS